VYGVVFAQVRELMVRLLLVNYSPYWTYADTFGSLPVRTSSTVLNFVYGLQGRAKRAADRSLHTQSTAHRERCPVRGESTVRNKLRILRALALIFHPG
jgi:hypothetical protein